MWSSFLPKNKSIRKTIINVVSLYLITTILLVLTLGFGYVYVQKEQLFNTQKDKIDYQANQIINQLEDLHDEFNYENIIVYPEFDTIKTAILDIDKNKLFSTLSIENIDFQKEYFYVDENVYFLYKIEPYYLGAAYLVIEKQREYKLQDTLFILGFSLFFIIIALVITSFFLAKILIKPLSDNVNLLDKFIKDTTHELNTPVSAILGNIEMLDLSAIDIKNKKKINRIKIGATTISSIYDDLSFLILNHKQISKNENINLSKLIESRIEYFKILADAKHISIQKNIKVNVVMNIDQLKVTRLIDNLISNGIKYSKMNSEIKICLDNNEFSIEDQGKGMSSNEIEHIFERYKRFDNTVGGFGIGYSIIATVLKEYDIKIEIDSKVNIGTKVTLTW